MSPKSSLMCHVSNTAASEFSVFAYPGQLAKIVSIKWENLWQSVLSLMQ